MSQALLFVPVYAIGLAFAVAFGPQRRPWLCCALAFPLGLVLSVASLIFLLGAGLPYNAWSLAAAAAILLAINGVVLVRRGAPDRLTLRMVALGSVAFVAICAALCSLNLSQFTYDSHYMIMVGEGLAQQQGLDHYTWMGLSKRGAFLVVAHSTARFIGVDYLYSLAPLLGANLVALFAAVLWHGLQALGFKGRRVALAISFVTATLFSTYYIGFHLLYIHTNMPSALYLFCFVVLFWIAEVEQKPALLPACFASLLAFSLLRLEAPIVAVLFVTLTLYLSRLPRRRLSVWFNGVFVAMGAWYGLLLVHVPTDSAFLSSSKASVMLVIVAAAVVGWWALPWRPVKRLSPYLPQIAGGMCLMALAATFYLKRAHMQESTLNFARNLSDTQFWGGFWYAALLLAILGMFVRGVPFGRVFSYGIPLYLGLVTLVGFLRIPYQYSYTDSANRMAVHVAPLIIFYFGLKYIPLALRQKSQDTGRAMGAR